MIFDRIALGARDVYTLSGWRHEVFGAGGPCISLRRRAIYIDGQKIAFMSAVTLHHLNLMAVNRKAPLDIAAGSLILRNLNEICISRQLMSEEFVVEWTNETIARLQSYGSRGSPPLKSGVN